MVHQDPRNAARGNGGGVIGRGKPPNSRRAPREGLALRPAGPPDAELLADLDVASFGSDHDTTLARFRSILPEPGRSAWILEADGRPIGKIHARSEDDGATQIVHDLCIDEDWRGQGLGAFMVSETLAKLSSSGASKISLQVSTRNAAALEVYARVGFRSEHIDEYWELHL